jgi:hypothetical protein
MITKLIVATGKSAGRSIAIKKNTLLIGRAEECDVRPLSEDVSRRHAAVHVGPADVWVEDLGSRNGTFVNGNRITAKTKVMSGDLIRVGALELTVSCTEPAAQAGGDQDVSKWLMADDAPAGMFDTTRSLRATSEVPNATTISAQADGDASSIHSAAPGTDDVHGSTISGIAGDAHSTSISGSATAKNSGSSTKVGQTVGEQKSDSSVAIEAVKQSNAKPGALPPSAQKGSVNSRDAAAEALKKFFGNR